MSGAAQLAGERAALGVAKAAQHDRREQEQVGRAERPAYRAAGDEESEHGQQPAAPASQNAGGGRSPARSTAKPPSSRAARR